VNPSPTLKGAEKALLHIIFDDPISCVRHGLPNQTKLVKRLGADQRNVGRRWQKILKKMGVWKHGQMDLWFD